MKTCTKLFGTVLLTFLAGACDKKNTETTPPPVTKSAKKDTAPHACVDRLLPIASEASARATAESLNPRNRLPPEGSSPITIMRYKKWKPGGTLHVRFIGGEATVVERVKKLAAEWMNFADIKLVFDNTPDAELRVSFEAGRGSWSYIGTDAKSLPATESTMNFGWFDSETSDAEYSRVVLHEFGHALGFIHEHQHPTNEIKWNKEVVYAYYAGEPNKWDKASVDRNVFAKYSTQLTQYSAYDATSIMEYPIPKEHTLDGFSAGWNTTLSKADKCFASSDQAYPKPNVCPP